MTQKVGYLCLSKSQQTTPGFSVDEPTPCLEAEGCEQVFVDKATDRHNPRINYRRVVSMARIGQIVEVVTPGIEYLGLNVREVLLLRRLLQETSYSLTC